MRTIPLVVGAVIVVAVGVLVGSGIADAPTILLVVVLGVVALPLCHWAATEIDPWLWWVASLGFVAKLLGSALRHFVLLDAYEGVGDSTGYHSWGVQLADIWRLGEIPGLDGSMGEGTQVVRWITGLLYAPYTPTFLGGFFIFATLAFIGQLLFYCAFRRAVPGARLGIYAFFVFFLPAMVFWPASIGKEALMILFLGIASYAFARSLESYSPLWLTVAGAGLLGAGTIRPHIAALLTASFAGATLIGRGAWLGSVAIRRFAVMGLALVLAGVAVVTFGDRYQVDDVSDVDPFVNELERRTQQGGSAVEGEAVFSPAALPGASLRVLFRPLPPEAHNLQSLASAIENTALLAFVLWKTPAMIRRIRQVRIPYVLMSTAFTIGFVIAFSTVFNLGILARQRSQVLPYLLATVVALGWDTWTSAGTDPGRHLAVAR